MPSNDWEWKRLSGRTYEQFSEDIKNATREERVIIEQYAEYVKYHYGIELHIEDNGCDNDGEFLEIEKVTKDADFIVNGKLVEVKTLEKRYKMFRLRVYAIEAYVKQGASMILVYGSKTENPLFCMVTPKMMKKWLREKPKSIATDWEYKKIMKFTPDEFDWKPLLINKSA